MFGSIIAACIWAIAGQDTCNNGPNSVCTAGIPDDNANQDDLSLVQTRVQVTDRKTRKVKDEPLKKLEKLVADMTDHAMLDGKDDKAAPDRWLRSFLPKSKYDVPPPSTTLQCILNLTIQYFLLYTLLQVLRTVNQFTGIAMLGWQKILETGCTTVTYAPALCCLFLGCRMRAIQLSQGKTEQYNLPQDWVQNAMYVCSYAVLVQVLLVLIVPFFTGEANVKTDADGNLDTSGMHAGGVVVMVLSLLRYIVMLCLYGGFASVCVGIHLMEGPKEIWGDDAPPVSPAVACTINLTTQFFCVYLLIAVSKTVVEVSGPSLFLTKLQGVLTLAKYTQNFVPMLSILFIGARMRALQMDPLNGSPQWWAQYCFYGCTFSVLLQTVFLILIPFITTCECKQGAVEGDSIFIMENALLGMLMTIFRYVAMLALYGGFTAVCVSVFTIEHPQDKSLTPPISPAMQCVMNLTIQYFGVYLILFLLITVKQFSSVGTDRLDSMIYTFEGAQKTIMFAPMLAVLFVGCRMRALQIIGVSSGGVIPPSAGPQSWAQDAMYLATWSLHVQLVMTILVPLITGASKPEYDESGNVKAPAGSGMVIGVVFDIIRYLCILSMYGGSVTIMVAIYYMTPETLPPHDAGPLIPYVKVPKPPSAPTPGNL